MGLILLFLLPLAGGLLVLLAGKAGARRAAGTGILLLALGLLVLLALLLAAPGDGRWLAEARMPWAPSLGVSLIFAMDGLSATLVALSLALGIVAIIVSPDVRPAPGLFHASILWTVAAANGVFLSFDLLVFAFFWELMLVPAFLLIAIWGHKARHKAAMKFLVTNATAGLGLIAAALYMGATGPAGAGFDAFALAQVDRPVHVQAWLLAGFALAFLVKLPVPPLHAWLPDAHTEAPTAGSILLAGILLKTGAYGLFRFSPMLFPEGFVALAPWGMALGAFGTIYAALVACGQTDAKRLVAYTSIAHMSIVLMGVAGGVHFAMMGAAVEMVAHAFSSSALFLLVGAVEKRTGTRDLRRLGGLQQTAPRFATAFAVFFSAALAMPGTANFLGEALVITGMFQVNWLFAALALVSLVISVVYATRLLRRIVFGEARQVAIDRDLAPYELWPLVLLGSCTLLFGLLPQILLLVLEPAVDAAIAALPAPPPIP
jgi:NADH-quinone oxidoreductase subunit M